MRSSNQVETCGVVNSWPEQRFRSSPARTWQNWTNCGFTTKCIWERERTTTKRYTVSLSSIDKSPVYKLTRCRFYCCLFTVGLSQKRRHLIWKEAERTSPRLHSSLNWSTGKFEWSHVANLPLPDPRGIFPLLWVASRRWSAGGTFTLNFSWCNPAVITSFRTSQGKSTANSRIAVEQQKITQSSICGKRLGKA